MRRIGEYGSENINLMEKLKTYLKDNNMLSKGTTILAIALDNPNLVPKEECRYDVGFITNACDTKTYPELENRNIDSGSYAIIQVEHTYESINKFWGNLQSITKNLNIDYSKPIIERYSVKMINNHLCEFCIPLKK